MKTNITKKLARVMVLVVLAWILHFQPMAENRAYAVTPESAFSYTTDANGATITGYNVVAGGTDVIVPDTLGGKPVIGLGPNSLGSKGLIRITLPSSLTTIGDWALSSNNLSDFIIPDSVTHIGFGAFFKNQLTNMTFPSSVTSIGIGQFQNNPKFKTATFLNKDVVIGDDSFYLISDVIINGYPGSTAQAYAAKYNHAFHIILDDASLTSVVGKACTNPGGGNGTTSGDSILYALETDNSKGTLAIEDIAVGTDATAKLYSDNGFTTEVAVGASIPLTVGNDTTVYIKVTASDNVTTRYYTVTIKRSPFAYTVTDNKVTITGYDHSANSDVMIPPTIEGKPVIKIGTHAFHNQGITSVVIPDSVVSIDLEAFAGNSVLSKVYFSGNPSYELDAFKDSPVVFYYTVTYNSNESTSGTAPTYPYKYFIKGTSIPVLGNTYNLERTGFSFAGWNTTVGGDGTSYRVGDNLTIGNQPIVLYALWEPIHTVTFNSDEGSALSTLSVINNQSVAAPPLPTRMNYTFDGWYALGELAPFNFTRKITTNMTLVAKWKPIPTTPSNNLGSTPSTNSDRERPSSETTLSIPHPSELTPVTPPTPAPVQTLNPEIKPSETLENRTQKIRPNIDSNGIASVSINEKTIQVTLDEAIKNNAQSLTLILDTSKQITGLKLQVDPKFIMAMKKSGIKNIEIQTLKKSYIFDTGSLSKLPEKTLKNLYFSIEQVNFKPGKTFKHLFKVNTKVGGTIIRVMMPYTLAKGEKPLDIKIYILKPNGKEELAKSVTYNSKTKQVTFEVK